MFRYRATDGGEPAGVVHVNNIVHDIDTAKKLLADQGHTGPAVKLAYDGKDRTERSPYWSS